MSSTTSSSKIFDIPGYYYFGSGNDYSGSLGDFSYKIKNGDTLKALIWHGRLCSEKAVIESEMDFEKTEAGFREMIKWIEAQYEKYSDCQI